MRTCSHCGEQNTVGAMVCKHCGKPLESERTFLLEESRPIITREDADAGGRIEEVAVVLHIVGAHEPLILRIASEILLGRLDAGMSQPDFVNLTDFGAVEKGVSRVHACIRRRGERVVLIDLSSSNGTFVNGQQLDPDQENVLFDGDAIYFGSLGAQISFVKES